MTINIQTSYTKQSTNKQDKTTIPRNKHKRNKPATHPPPPPTKKARKKKATYPGWRQPTSVVCKSSQHYCWMHAIGKRIPYPPPPTLILSRHQNKGRKYTMKTIHILENHIQGINFGSREKLSLPWTWSNVATFIWMVDELPKQRERERDREGEDKQGNRVTARNGVGVGGGGGRHTHTHKERIRERGKRTFNFFLLMRVME